MGDIHGVYRPALVTNHTLVRQVDRERDKRGGQSSEDEGQKHQATDTVELHDEVLDVAFEVESSHSTLESHHLDIAA